MTLNLAGLQGSFRGDPVADVRRVALGPMDLLAVILPPHAIPTRAASAALRDAVEAELRAAGLPNRAMIFVGGIDLATVGPA